MKTYSIVKVFGTIQGEGNLAGTPAAFVRFAGCNMWSGLEEHRERDSARNEAECPRWCDTDFRARERATAAEIATRVKALGPRRLVVLTGGEPMLQVDDELLDALAPLYVRVQIETNGTTEPNFQYHNFVYVTVSPKVAKSRIRLLQADELKLVWPAYAPEDWSSFVAHHRFLQAQADPDGRSPDVEARLVEYVQTHPEWRLSLQTHKFLGIE